MRANLSIQIVKSSAVMTSTFTPNKPRLPKTLSDYQQSLAWGKETSDRYLAALIASGDDMHVALTTYCNDGILHDVAVSSFPDHLRVLIAAGADPHRKGMDNRTALFEAAKQGKTEACAILLQAGVDPDEKDKMGLTPRRMAVARGRDDVVALFEAHDAIKRIAEIRSKALAP